MLRRHVANKDHDYVWMSRCKITITFESDHLFFTAASEQSFEEVLKLQDEKNARADI